jgi:hypothetical protein
MKTYGWMHVEIHVFFLARREWAASRLCLFTPRGKKTRYSLDKRLGGPHSRSGRYGEVEILDCTGTRTPTLRSSSLVVFRYLNNVGCHVEVRTATRAVLIVILKCVFYGKEFKYIKYGMSFSIPQYLRGLSPPANYTDRTSAASSKLARTFADRGGHVVSLTDPLPPYYLLCRPEPLLFLQHSS